MLTNELIESEIIDLLEKNPLDRNKYLTSILGILKSMNFGTILCLDGEWGTGKTVFCKQLEYILNADDVIKFPITAGNPNKRFYGDYIAMYFNAWENDLYPNPLNSLIRGLIDKLALLNPEFKTSEDVMEKAVKVLEIISNCGLGVISGGAITTEEIKKLSSDKDFFDDTFANLSRQKDKVSELLNIFTKEKKIVIILDELDRCKPLYAVEVLEVMKHFFVHERVTFLVSCNKRELACTVKGMYGQDFDGFKYLDRFFAVNLYMPRPVVENYIKFIMGPGIEKAAHPIYLILPCGYFDFNLREINRYYTHFRILSGLIAGNKFQITKSDDSEYLRRIVTPYLLGLKMKSAVAYRDFFTTEGFDGYVEYVRVVLFPYFQKVDNFGMLNNRGELDIEKMKEGHNDLCLAFDESFQNYLNRDSSSFSLMAKAILESLYFMSGFNDNSVFEQSAIEQNNRYLALDS